METRQDQSQNVVNEENEIEGQSRAEESTAGSSVKNTNTDNHNKPPVKIAILIIFFIVVCAIGVWLLVSSGGDAEFRSPAPITATSQEPADRQAEAKEVSSYSVKHETANVAGMSGEVSLGFNNAEQIVDAGNGSTFVVWVSDGKLILATRDNSGAVTKTQTLAEGQITLPAIAKSGNIFAVAWSQQNTVKAVVSKDGGSTFGKIYTLGNGTGSSIAADNGKVVAVWHNGKEGSSPSEIMFSKHSGSSWSSAARIDKSDKTPLWASVSYKDDNVFAVWRDNRGGRAYTIWLRRSADGGQTWQTEQNIVSDFSGDPDICTADGKTVWIAHHGKGKISLIKSSDGAVNFGSSVTVGDGYFAHLSCTNSLVGVAWESTQEDAKAKNKKVGWAIYRTDGTLVGREDISDGDTAASTIYVGDNEAEVLWVKNSGSPLAGTLRHTILALR